MIKVAISVFGKFHLFHLARQLERRELLSHIVSTYPQSKLGAEKIPPHKLHSFPYVHLPWLALNRYRQGYSPLGRELSWWNALSLDAAARGRLGEANTLVAISGSGLKTGKEVQRRGGIYICDRGSSHIGYGDALLREEFARWKIPYRPVDPRHIAREEKEYAQADAITVPSEFARSSFLAKGIPAEKMRKTPYGVDVSRFSPIAEPNPSLFDVTFVGQVSLRKGVPYLLQAFAAFRHPRKRLRIIGTVLPDMQRLLRDGRLPTEGVEFLGSVPQSVLNQFLSRSHVLVLPSIEEGLALVQGEAMACGCPLISSVNSGGQDLFQDGKEGFIIPIRDPQAITERLERLVQNPDLRNEMSAAALRRVKSLGGWDHYGSQYAAVLEELTVRVKGAASPLNRADKERALANS